MKNPDENNYVTDIVGATVIMTRELADYATTVEKPYNQLEFGVIITRLGSVQVDIYEKPDQDPKRFFFIRLDEGVKDLTVEGIVQKTQEFYAQCGLTERIAKEQV